MLITLNAWIRFGSIAADRLSGQADALRKLTGGQSSPSSAANPSLSSTMERKTSNSVAAAAEPISLAAFMGGKATGPRLNRPTPQPDAHDPTMFEQRTLADISTPHPVFGSGGIALPGLASKGRTVVEQTKTGITIAAGKLPSATSKPVPDPKPAATLPTTPLRGTVRERTLSTPSPFAPPKPVERQSPAIPEGSPGVRNRVESLYAHANRSTERMSVSPVLKSSKSFDKPAKRPAAPAKPESLRKSTSTIPPSTDVTSSSVSSPPRSHTPTSQPLSASPPIATPSLARPVQPSPRPPSMGPRVSLGTSPAPAFLKPPQQKDLTPSLSRLQGRGFVQNFVKLSGEIEAAVGKSPDRSVSPRTNSVMDRWNPPQSPSPSASPSPAPPLRKAKTLDMAVSQTPEPTTETQKARPTPPPKTTRSQSHTAASMKSAPTQSSPALKIPVPGDVLPLGSSNTLISYIKTNKTGDAPPTDANDPPRRSKTPSQHVDESRHAVDEMGMRSRSRSRSRGPLARGGPSPSPSAKSKRESKPDISSVPSSGRPLNHVRSFW